MQVKQIGIACDDACGLAGYREFQKLIVSDITAGQDCRLRVHVHGVLDEPVEKDHAFVAGQIVIEFRALQYPRQF
jgi:hypothetical protein